MCALHRRGSAVTSTRAPLRQASTSEVYGDPTISPQPEEYWGNVNCNGVRSCYDEGKRCAETLCFDYHRQNGVDIRVVRIFNTYGPGMHPYDGRVVSNFLVQARRPHRAPLHRALPPVRADSAPPPRLPRTRTAATWHSRRAARARARDPRVSTLAANPPPPPPTCCCPRVTAGDQRGGHHRLRRGPADALLLLCAAPPPPAPNFLLSSPLSLTPFTPPPLHPSTPPPSSPSYHHPPAHIPPLCSPTTLALPNPSLLTLLPPHPPPSSPSAPPVCSVLDDLALPNPSLLLTLRPPHPPPLLSAQSSTISSTA